MDNQEQEKELSPEEIKEYKAKMLAFYKEQLPFIKAQEEYERLTASIAESRTKRIMMEMKLQEILTPRVPEKQERKLKETVN